MEHHFQHPIFEINKKIHQSKCKIFLNMRTYFFKILQVPYKNMYILLYEGNKIKLRQLIKINNYKVVISLGFTFKFMKSTTV